MNKLKKLFCLLITTLLFLTFSVCVFASNGTIEDAIKIEVATDKAEYKVLGIAEITATITNTGNEPIENITAQAVFNDLAPVKNSETSKSVDILKAGESISFTYNATLNKNEHDLNIFQKIFLWIVRLFNGGYTATNNSIDVVAEDVTEITFGKFTAKNVVQVGYESNITSDDSIEEQIQQTEYVQNAIDDFCNSNEYKNSSSEEQISLMKSFLNDLEKNGEIKNIIFSTDGWVTFEFQNGWESGIELVDSHAEDCFQSSTSSAYIDDTRYTTEILTLSENTYSNKFDKWTFSVGTTDSCYSIQELANQYSALGVSIERKELATVQTYKEFSDSKFIYIMSHGDTIDGIPVIKTEEIATKEKKDLYADIINRGDVKAHKIKKTGIWYFYIYPSFFENNYKNDELNDAIVYIGSCNAFGSNNIENHSFYESFKKAGASTVIGFCNSVNQAYSNYFAEKILYYLSLGYSIGESFNETVNVLGENGNIFWEQYGEPDIKKDDEYPAYPIIRGETNITLFDKQIDGLGTFTATISDDYTNNPIENVAVEIKSTANIELYHLLKTNSNGTFSIYLPEGNYTCELLHKDYVRKEFEFNVEADNNIVILNSYYLTPKTYLMGTVIDKETNKPVENASVLLRLTDEETGMYFEEYTCSTDSNGKFEISVPVGTYTYTINKLDMTNELYEDATGTVTVNKADGNILGTVYLSPKDNSGDDNTGDSEDTEERTVIDSGDCGADGDNVTWTLYEDGELVISGSGPMNDYGYGGAPWNSNKDAISNITIEYDITYIGSSSFYNCKTTAIKIPDSVTSIGGAAFMHCTKLKEIEIPNSVTSISDHAFYGCTNLVSIKLSNNATGIGYNTFRECINLSSVEIPDSVTNIGSSAFKECTSLASIKMSDNITSIGDYAFDSCISLSSIDIPDSVKTIGDFVFDDCNSLENIIVDTNNQNYASEDGVLFNKSKSTLIRYPIGNLRTYYSIPTGVKNIYSYAFYDCINLNSIEIPNSVTNINEKAFCLCTNLTSIIMSNTLTNIGKSAFERCEKMTSIEIPQSVASIGSGAFASCESISSIKIPNNVTKIEYGTFSRCSSLTSIETPDSVTMIGDYAFDYCTSIESIEIPNSVSSIGEGTFRNCTNLTSIEIPESITSIGGNAFDSCESISSIKIPNSITKIEYGTFTRCSSLTSIEIPDSVTEIGGSAFRSCTSLTQIRLPSKVTNIGNSAFEYCTSLVSIKIPNSVTSIGTFTFSLCQSLQSIEIPNSVKNIDGWAFSYCDKLNYVYYSGTQEEWEAITIGDYNECLTNATIHYNS